jgi:hypothetical protein
MRQLPVRTGGIVPISKTPVEGEIQFSELPIARLASLASPAAEAVEWQGFLTTATRLKGSLDQGFSVEGKTAYSKLGAKRGALQSPKVDGEVHLKADYKANALQLQQAELRMPASTISMTQHAGWTQILRWTSASIPLGWHSTTSSSSRQC